MFLTGFVRIDLAKKNFEYMLHVLLTKKAVLRSLLPFSSIPNIFSQMQSSRPKNLDRSWVTNELPKKRAKAPLCFAIRI